MKLADLFEDGDAGATVSGDIAVANTSLLGNTVITRPYKKFKKKKIKEDVSSYDLHKKYDEFNRLYFNNELPKIKLSYKAMKGAGGKAVAKLTPPESINPRYRKLYGKFYGYKTKKETIEIQIDSLIKRSETKLDGILLHEMVHVYFLNKDMPYVNHGAEFIDKINEISKKSGIDVPIDENIDVLNTELNSDVKSKELGVIVLIKQNSISFSLVSKKTLLAKLIELQNYWNKVLPRSDDIRMVTATIITDPEWTRLSAIYPINRTLNKFYTYRGEVDLIKKLAKDGQVLYLNKKD